MSTTSEWGNDARRPPAERAAVWLYLATEDAVRLAQAGQRVEARGVVADAARAGEALRALGVLDGAALDAWRDDTNDALALRGAADVDLPPWWAATPPAEDRTAAAPAAPADRSAATYVRWLASTLIAAWPVPLVDPGARFAVVVDALRHAGVAGAQFEEAVRSATEGIARGRPPRGWPAPPTGAVATGSAALDLAIGPASVRRVRAHPEGWEVDATTPAARPTDPWWAVDDRGGLYFGASTLTEQGVRVAFRPGLAAEATALTVRLGFGRARADIDVGTLR